MRVAVPLLLFASLAPVNSPHAQECSAEATRQDTRAVHGVVRDDSGKPVPEAQVTASWSDWRIGGYSAPDRIRTVSVKSAKSGSYRFCGLPRNASISIQAVAASRSLGVVTVPPTSSGGETGAPEFFRREPAADFVMLRGVVRDSSGSRISDARVAVPGGSSMVSDEHGRFEVRVPRAGEVAVEVRRLGYKPRSLRLADAARSGAIDLVLEPAVIVLKGVTVSALPGAFESASGFGERRRRGTGTFFDRAALDRMRPQTLTDVLRSVGGIQVHTAMTRWGYQTTPSSTRATGGAIGCSIDYYVNGHQYTPTSMGIDRDMAPDQIEAIEVYKSSEIPPQFLGRRSRCGVVVIWTRYRAHELDG